MTARCFVERIAEKCGETAAAASGEELSKVLDEVKEACDEAGVEAYVFSRSIAENN